jgi:hypothetical protein
MNGSANEGREGVVAKLAAEALRRSGEVRVVGLGSSMLPAIFPGDTLIVRRATVWSARRGEIVLCFRQGRFCAHRLVDKRAEKGGGISLITRGDALGKNDPPVAEDELLGRVTAVIREGKRTELRGRLAVRERLLQQALRKSNGALKWLLRWHSLRSRLVRMAGAPPARLEAKPAGSI